VRSVPACSKHASQLRTRQPSTLREILHHQSIGVVEPEDSTCRRQDPANYSTRLSRD